MSFFARSRYERRQEDRSRAMDERSRLVSVRVVIYFQTAKAIRVYEPDEGVTAVEAVKAWVPKKLIANRGDLKILSGEDLVIKVPLWLAKDRGFMYY